MSYFLPLASKGIYRLYYIQLLQCYQAFLHFQLVSGSEARLFWKYLEQDLHFQPSGQSQSINTWEQKAETSQLCLNEAPHHCLSGFAAHYGTHANLPSDCPYLVSALLESFYSCLLLPLTGAEELPLSVSKCWNISLTLTFLVNLG